MKRVIEVPTIGAEVNILFTIILEWASGVARYLQKGRLSKSREEAREI